MAEPTKAELQQQLTEMTTRATKAEGRVAELGEDINTRTAERDEARQLAGEHGRRIDVLEQEKRELSNQLRAYKGSATKARDQVTILKAELSPETRAIGAPKPAKTEEERAARAEALDAAFAMGPTTIVFSDGRREIRELAPLIVSDVNGWLQTPYHRELNHDPIIEPVGERAQVELAGFGLLNAAGEQVGYCPLPARLPIGRGVKMRLPKGTIKF